MTRLTTAGAVEFDVRKAFSVSENPNGSWSYGWFETLDSPFQIHTNSGQYIFGTDPASFVYSPLVGWWTWLSPWGHASPGVMYNASNAPVQIWPDGPLVESGFLELHPAFQYSVARWSAPMSGVCLVAATFSGVPGGGQPVSIDARVLHNGGGVFDAIVAGESDEHSYVDTIAVAAGDTIDFAVGYGEDGTFFGDITQLKATINLTSGPGPPTIWLQPTSQTNYVGETVQLRVVATGTWPFDYQWRKDGENLVGATNATFVLTNATVAASGDYTVTVANNSGSVSSAVARIRITSRPWPYVENFEGMVGQEWSDRRTDVTPVGNRRFLGQFGNDTVSLTLPALPPHQGVTIALDLFVIQTWDADGIYYGGPDLWELCVVGGPTLLRTTFSNTEPPSGENPTQAFPDAFPGSFHPAHTGAAEIDTLGYWWMGDSVYTLAFTFHHTDSVVTFNFAGQGLQDLYDESWGLDNVRVSLDPSPDALFLQQRSVFVSESSTQVQLEVYRVSLNPLATSVTVDFATTDGTAKAGEDYVAVSGTLTFGLGETNKTISIVMLNDAVAEFDEQFTLTLSNPSQTILVGTSNVVVRIRDDDPRFFVAEANLNPVAPYTTWETAATNIQDAIRVATEPGWNILVTNGLYRVGTADADGTNRVALTNSLIVRSVNGPAATIIDGEGAVRGAYLGPYAVLSGFTITNGLGGGVLADGTATVTNCLIVGNQGRGASGGKLFNCLVSTNTDGGVTGATLYNCTVSGNSTYKGGGAHGSALSNCVLTGNSAVNGGGASFSTLNNCTLTGNSADGDGGGAYGGTLYNSLVCSNRAENGANYFTGSAFWGGDVITLLHFSCTTPFPTNNFGNITLDPLFVDHANGNFRLQTNSPCINAGCNTYTPGATDLDGNPRIVSGTVDIGAYEYQGSGSVISYAWLQRYGLPTDGSADTADPDADRLNTWQEWRCQTDPTNALSVLRLLSAEPAGNNVLVRWSSVEGVNYFLERSTDLGATAPFAPLATGLLGLTGTYTFTDTNAALLPNLFYRVGVGD